MVNIIGEYFGIGEYNDNSMLYFRHLLYRLMIMKFVACFDIKNFKLKKAENFNFNQHYMI